MLKIITIRNYNILRMKDKNDMDHVMVIELIRKTPQEKFLPLPDKIAIPKISGIANYTDFPKKYDIKVVIDDEVGIDDSRDPVTSVLGFPVPKSIGEQDDNYGEESDVKQVLDDNVVENEYKILRSEDGNSYVAVSNKGVVLKSGNTRFIISEDQMTKMGKTVEYGLPENDQGIVKESGMMRLLPKCFVPPFSLPDYLPNTDLALKASRLAKVLKEMKDVL